MSMRSVSTTSGTGGGGKNVGKLTKKAVKPCSPGNTGQQAGSCPSRGHAEGHRLLLRGSGRWGLRGERLSTGLETEELFWEAGWEGDGIFSPNSGFSRQSRRGKEGTRQQSQIKAGTRVTGQLTGREWRRWSRTWTLFQLELSETGWKQASAPTGRGTRQPAVPC